MGSKMRIIRDSSPKHTGKEPFIYDANRKEACEKTYLHCPCSDRSDFTANQRNRCEQAEMERLKNNNGRKYIP